MNIIVPYLTGDGYFMIEGDGWCHDGGNGVSAYQRGDGRNNLPGPSLFGKTRGSRAALIMKCIVITQ